MSATPGRWRTPATARTVLSAVAAGAGTGLLVLVLALAGLLVLVPRVTGGVPLTVRSGSMEPALPVGSLAVVLPVEADQVRVGDVVTYLPNPDDPTAVTHRVTAVTHRPDGDRVFTTQGDANASADPPVAGHQLRGRLAYAVPWVGHLNDAMHGDRRAPAVCLVAGLLFAWAVRLWWRAWRTRQPRRTRQAPGTRRARRTRQVSRPAGRPAGPGR